MSASIVAALRQLMNYVGGWDEKPTHPCGIARDALAAWDAGERPATIDMLAAVQAVADDYIEQRINDNGEGTGRDGLEELVNEAIGHACMVLGVDLELPRDEDMHDAIAEELTDRYTTTTDDTRSNGPRQ